MYISANIAQKNLCTIRHSVGPVALKLQFTELHSCHCLSQRSDMYFHSGMRFAPQGGSQFTSSSSSSSGNYLPSTGSAGLSMGLSTLMKHGDGDAQVGHDQTAATRVLPWQQGKGQPRKVWGSNQMFHPTNMQSKAGSGCPAGGWPLLQGSTPIPLDPAIQTARAAGPDSSTGKIQTFPSPFSLWIFPLLKWSGPGIQMWPFGQASPEQPEAAPMNTTERRLL